MCTFNRIGPNSCSEKENKKEQPIVGQNPDERKDVEKILDSIISSQQSVTCCHSYVSKTENVSS